MHYKYLFFENIWGLYSLINRLKNPKYEFLQSQYNQYHLFYSFSFDLLEELGFIYNEDDKIKISQIYSDNLSDKYIATRDQFNGVLIDLLFMSEVFTKDLNQLLEKSIFEDSQLKINFKYHEKLHFSDIRNFLIGIGLLEHHLYSGNYFFTEDYIDKLIYQKSSRNRKLSIEYFEEIQKRNKEIGLLAELEVMDLEIEKLIDHKNYKDGIVEQISISDVGAGYDILSYLPINDYLSPIKIEVKAVSPTDYKFYLSDGELLAAKQDPENYYLYLLPMVGENEFDIGSMMIIRNLFENIINDKKWNEKIESRSYSLGE